MVAPLEIPLRVAGNFMELRPNHYHSGVDLKTDGRQGLPVHAAADGQVSRIKVGPWGYGLALYIDHPGGLTTVYGHLSRFAPEIAQYALDTHYRQRSSSIDIGVPAGALPVKADQVVAYSGNTGGSAAPHLHFEVRRTADQHALDPQAYGLHLEDDLPPVLRGVRFYPLDTGARVSPYPGRALGFPTEGGQGHYTLRPGDHPAALGAIGIAVHAVDHYNGSDNTCGVRRLELQVNGTTSSEVHLDEVDFEKQRYVNARMDYGLYADADMHYHRLYDLPNDRSGLLTGKDHGRIVVAPDDTLDIRIIAIDAAGNSSTLTFQLIGADPSDVRGFATLPGSTNMFHWDRDNQVNLPGFRMTIPAHALYEDVPMEVSRQGSGIRDIGPRYQVMDDRTPLQSACQMRIDVPGLEERLWEKALVVRSDRKGRPSPEGGRYADGSVTTTVKQFGTFSVRIDTLPPKVTPVDLRADMRGRTAFQVRVDDDLSGIDSWTATLDGNWVLMTYDPKQHRLTHTFDSHSAGAGDRQFHLEVTDERGNRTVLDRQFIR
ncbi:MAG: peptidoglycan DD-metalloendopeptidase family protein [Flavobacteriales bacterium]|nr:peptidoglycan DD-metalloendopeptidase family protein [Flavobacteriales bacterium]